MRFVWECIDEMWGACHGEDRVRYDPHHTHGRGIIQLPHPNCPGIRWGLNIHNPAQSRERFEYESKMEKRN